MRQFSALSDPRRINVKPSRIRIKSISRTDSMDAALRSLGIPNDDLKEVALLNGIDLKERVSANTLLKVIERGDTFQQ